MHDSPVRAFSEFLFKRPDDDFLNPLISLGDEVHSGALCHDSDFTLSSFPNFLIKYNFGTLSIHLKLFFLKNAHFSFLNISSVMFNAVCTLEVSHQTRHTAPAFLATATAKSYAFCHGSSILLLYGGLLRRVCKRKAACKTVTAKKH